MYGFFLPIENNREIKVSYASVYAYYAFNRHIDHVQKASDNLIYVHLFGGWTFIYKYKIIINFILLKRFR